MSTLTTSISTATASFESPRLGLAARLTALLAKFGTREKADDIGQFIDANGGVLTDQLEREISRRFGSMAGR